MNIEKKLCIGTVKFGLNYGAINNQKIRINEIKRIFNYLNNTNINFLDTASSYGTSEKTIGKIKSRKFNIISKIYIKNIDSNIEKYLKKSFQNLKTKKIYGILIHNSEILLKKESYKIYEQLCILKKKKLVNKIGISVYDTEVLKKIIKKFKFDIVQFQANVFDRSFLKNQKLKYYKSLGMELHVRSIFLQGVLLSNKIPKKIRDNGKILKKYYNYLKKNNLNPLDFCLNFILQFKEIDKIIVGIDNLNNLKQIIKFKKINKKFLTKKFITKNKKFN